MGCGVAFFQFVCHQQIYWNVPATAFIVLVAVGADYNLLLITRIREEATNGIRSGIIRAVRSTGGVITSAGIIFAASMFGHAVRQRQHHGADRVHHRRRDS